MSIETNRLKLIELSEKHINDIFNNFTKEITTYMYPKPPEKIDDTRDFVMLSIKQREDKTDYVFAITLKDTDEFIGLVGLHKIDKEPDFGIWTKKSAHGKHYGREAIGGLVEYTKTLGIEKVTYPVDRRNIASKKIALHYGGKLISDIKEVENQSGDILEIEEYEINLYQSKL